jgi:uncharacterized protein (DUF2147 family)
MIKIGFILMYCFVASHVYAQTCVGKWTTIDDKTGKKKAIVELYKENHKLFGKIIYLYPREGREPNPKCTRCTDDRKDQALEGLQIVRNLSWDGEEWEDGSILDPENGKVYELKIWIEKNNPDKLYVRGYIGPFFRTQNWFREKEK